MIRAVGPVVIALLLAGCGSGLGDDVTPLPKQDAESARALMNEAERAASNASDRMEQLAPSNVPDRQPTR
ncbi:hypothetical protein GCM10022280_13750 [Sphingomonas swuensis]|uniref:Lipoprotein n=1 Tax=Sphingomonas swuensis TaxID=977800 RepID=A0ABP7SSY8_9SPHN